MIDDALLRSLTYTMFDVIFLYFKAVKCKLCKLYVYHLEEIHPANLILATAKLVVISPTWPLEPIKITSRNSMSTSISGRHDANRKDKNGTIYPRL